jgi:hypothetical protein
VFEFELQEFHDFKFLEFLISQLLLYGFTAVVFLFVFKLPPEGVIVPAINALKIGLINKTELRLQIVFEFVVGHHFSD